MIQSIKNKLLVIGNLLFLFLMGYEIFKTRKLLKNKIMHYIIIVQYNFQYIIHFCITYNSI